jgi:hypothetical protein
LQTSSRFPAVTAPDPDRRRGDEEPAPFLGSWGALYAVVLGALAACIGAFYALTVTFG